MGVSRFVLDGVCNSFFVFGVLSGRKRFKIAFDGKQKERLRFRLSQEVAEMSWTFSKTKCPVHLTVLGVTRLR